MKKKIIFIYLFLFFSCKNPVNTIDKNGNKQGFWTESDVTKRVHKGLYKDNIKIGVWHTTINDSISTSVEYFIEDSSRNIISYFEDSKVVYKEETKYSQSIKLDVSDSLKFIKIKDRLNIERIGFDLFLFRCSSCHNMSSNKLEHINKEGYLKFVKLNSFLKEDSSFHLSIGAPMNNYEIMAISEYVNSLKPPLGQSVILD